MARQTVDAFVDDSNLSVNERGVREYNERTGKSLDLKRASEQAYQSYEKYLFLSGGKLALKKCKHYYITFQRKERRYIFSLKRPKQMGLTEGTSTRRVVIRAKKAN